MISGFSFTYLLGPSKDNRYFLCGALNASKATSRRNRQPTCSAPDHGLGMAGPIYDVGVVRSISFWKCHRPHRLAPRTHSGLPLFPCVRKKTSSHKPRHFSSIPSGLRRKNQKVFFMRSRPRLIDWRIDSSCTPSASAISLIDLPRMICASNSAALDLRQRIESVPQTKKGFHSFKELLRGRLMQASGILNPVIAVQRILRLVPGDPPLVGLS